MRLCNFRTGQVTKILTVAFRITVVVLLMLQLTPRTPASGRATSRFNDPAEVAVFLSTLEANGDTDGLYRGLHPDAKEVVSKRVIAGWYNAEFFPLIPQQITEIISVNYVSWTWEVTGTTYHETAEVTYVQPFGTGASQYLVTETVRLVSYGNGNWGWFFGRSREFVDEQVRIHDPGSSASAEPTKAATRTTRTPSNSSSNSGRSTSQPRPTMSQGSTQNCTLVELAPGYPGYRGLVTGLSPQWGGLGDQECLEKLERNNPGFDKAREDKLNLDAARSLGINGDPSVWLWENWMAIEAQRGISTNCYTCLMFDPELEPINTSVPQDWADPRIQAGLLGSTNAIDLHLVDPMMRDNFTDDYEFRVHAFLVAGPSANANDILRVYREIASGQHWYGFDAADYIYDIGGYSWVTPAAYLDDQVFSVVLAFWVSTFQLVPVARDAVMTRLDEAILDWKSDVLQGSTEPLADYLRRELDL